MHQFDETLGFIDELNRVHTAAEVCSGLLKITGQYGLDRMLAGTQPAAKSSARQQRECVLLSGWPGEWMERYVLKNYARIDPIVQHVKMNLNPFAWDEASDHLENGAPGSLVMNEAREFGMSGGIAIPLVTVDGTMALVSLGGEQPEVPPYALGMISLISTYAIGRAMQISANLQLERNLKLTKREAECIRWASEGKSEWEISIILGISEHTSEKHLLNAKSKLGAVNRTQAVAEAIRRGYIT